MTDYKKYEFPNQETFNIALEELGYTPDNMVILGDLTGNGRFYVDILWTNYNNIWVEYQIYPGVDTSHTFLGRNDYQYNTEINLQLALLDAYPHYVNKDVTLIPMDNLHNLIRRTPVSTKGVKNRKEYYYNDSIVWSIESVYWFEVEKPDHNDGGIVKIHTWYDKSGSPLIITKRFIPISDEDKARELKIFRENAILYLKSREPQLFNLLYGYFRNAIRDYIDVGDKDTFEQKLLNFPDPTVQLIFSQEIPMLSGGTITVIDGILAELL